MAVESAEDLAGFFDPDEFGKAMVLLPKDGEAEVPFNGIPTSGPVSEQSPAGRASNLMEATMMVPKIIATRASIPTAAQDDRIRMHDGTVVQIVDQQYKGDLVIIQYHTTFDGSS